MAKRSQSGISDRVPAGMYHRLQCSARRVRISVKWLILFGEWVVTQRGLLGFAARRGASTLDDTFCHQLGLTDDQLRGSFLGVWRVTVFGQEPPDGPPHVGPHSFALRPVNLNPAVDQGGQR